MKNEKTYCKNCGKEIKSGTSFCSQSCNAKWFNHLRHIQKMKKVEETNGVGCDFRRIKEYILETRGHRCEICGTETWMGKHVPLILDHINGRASDDRLDNLRLVCCNCDAQLPTYKSKNKNSDRKKRKGVWK